MIILIHYLTKIGIHFAYIIQKPPKNCDQKYKEEIFSNMVKDSKRVLIVDDEETLTWSMARSLSKDKDNYEVMIANNGREALNLLKKIRLIWSSPI